jgi:hypothetical protein
MRPDAPQCLTDKHWRRQDIRHWRRQHCPDTRSISIQQGVCFHKSTLFGKSLQTVQKTWQHVRMMSSSSKYSKVPFERGRDFSEDRSDARSSHPDVNQIKIKLRCFWKDTAENRLDVATSVRTLASQSPNLSSFWGLLKPINRGL